MQNLIASQTFEGQTGKRLSVGVLKDVMLINRRTNVKDKEQ